MSKANTKATTPLSDGAPEPTVYSIPFPVKALDLPDEAVVLTFWSCWLAHQAERKGISPERLTLESAEAIRIATLAVDAENVTHAALEKILRRIAGCAPGHENKTAEMIRMHIRDGALHIAALDEAATGRRRQRANSRKDRPDGLQSIILEILKKRPAVTQTELIEQLRLFPTGDIIDGINDDDETIDWHDKHKSAVSTSFVALTHRMRRARKKIGSR